MKFWTVYLYMFIICLFFFGYNIYLKRKLKVSIFFEDMILKSPQKFYMSYKNKFLTNIEKSEIEIIKNNITKNIYSYKDYKIIIEKNGFYLEAKQEYNDEIYILQDKLEEERERVRKEKDSNYYFQKENAMKLGFILQEINELKREVLKKSDIGYLMKVENIESKLEFFVNFMYGKMNIIFHKYRMNYPENIIKLFEMQFKNKVEFKLDKTVDIKEKIYFEEDKFFHFFKAIIYSILKNGTEILEINMKIDKNLLSFNIIKINNIKDGKSSNDEEFFEIAGIRESGWRFTILENGEFYVGIPLNENIPEWTKEEKQIEIVSDLKNIKTVERNIIYDMYSKGFIEKDTSDIKLIIDELLTNAIEHGNKYDDSKKVVINYRFRERDEGIEIDISDEGEGFSIEKIKEPDSGSERGRGIFIVRKLTNYINYINNGKKVCIYKKRSIQNDSEQL